MNEERVIVFLVSYHAGTRRERFHRPDVIGIYSSLAAAQTATALDDYWSGNPAVAQRQRDDPGPDPDWLRWTCEHLYEHDDDVRWAAWGTEDRDDVTNHPAPYSRFYEIVPYYVDGGYVPFQHLPGGHRCSYTDGPFCGPSARFWREGG